MATPRHLDDADVAAHLEHLRVTGIALYRTGRSWTAEFMTAGVDYAGFGPTPAEAVVAAVRQAAARADAETS